MSGKTAKEGGKVYRHFASRVLAVIGVVTLSATAAHAGHGQGGGGTTVQGYECYFVQGVNEQVVVNLDGNDASTSFADQTNIGIAQARLVCVAVTVNLVSRPSGLTEFDTLPLSNALVLKCYNMAQINANNPAIEVKVTDGVDIETVPLQSGKFVCLNGVITP
jgi:hypothetical protein